MISPTAYHVADYVLVLHGASVEAGPADEVIRSPAHPYTRSLVNSSPWPDPDRRWLEFNPDVRAGWSSAATIGRTIRGLSLHSDAGVDIDGDSGR